MATVKVWSQLHLELHVDEMMDGLGQHTFSPNPPGMKTARRKGPVVELKPGDNEVDADFWTAWLAQNKDGQLIKSGAVKEQKVEEPKHE